MTATPESKHTHTSGPWSVDDEACFVFGRDGHMVAELRGVGVKRTEGEIAANGELIASAPALLEALKKIAGNIELPLELFSSCKTHEDRMITAAEARRRFDRETALKAIALAEGRGK